MPVSLDRDRVSRLLQSLDLRELFIGELGWDHGGADLEVTAAGRTFALEAIAHKRGLVAYQYVADSDDAFPDHPVRQKIERAVAGSVREHLVVYATSDRNTQCWQWVKREAGRPDRTRTHIYSGGQSGEALIQKLEHLVFTLEEEEGINLVEVSGRLRAAFDVEPVTRRFYDRFKQEHKAFLDFIEGITATADREWYASLMLNRMMFIYFIQKRGFLDGDPDYLRNRLERVRREQGRGKFHSFYRVFLVRLFHEGLGRPEAGRDPELVELLGRVPYLNGGLFDVHDLERDNADIHIPDDAFEHIFAFFEAYQWHLDDRPLRNDNEINPDVLGYIFEKYINQKQMGAYYTKEDITGYISRNTVIPFLFDQARRDCAIAFKPDGGVWRLLSADPDRYFYDAVRHGISNDLDGKTDPAAWRPLPPKVAAGLDDVSKRGAWNEPAEPEYALPTETWREHVARRRRYEEVRSKLAAGEVNSINDLITYNLDIEKFAQDVIAGSEGPELVRAFWKALRAISVLDPACGSGAFLFAALNILEPLYDACLDAMRGFLDDLEHSRRKYRPEKLRDFREALTEVDRHASERYFILKSIVIDNLYGVDIMEEAVEICKLRLFLKLVAQLERYDQIEPLPDIDFNVRGGNTLVGFTSLPEVKRALGSDLVKQLSLPDIEERAEIADRAFRRFRAMQTEHGLDAGAFTDAKVELRRRLDDLRDELDGYLAGDYGVKAKAAFRRWRESHQPFHWFVEFYGIMQRGGFDVIIGNPPYIELKTVKQYELRGYECAAAGNLYAVTLERSISLCRPQGRSGFIVPVSSISTDRYASLQRELSKWSLYYSSFDDRPSKLFEGLQHIRLTIHVLVPARSRPVLYSTRYNKWNGGERASLFQGLRYSTARKGMMTHALPKLCCGVERGVLQSLENESCELARFYSPRGRNRVHYSRKLGYFLQVLDFMPRVLDGSGSMRLPSEFKTLHFGNGVHARSALCVLNSNLFYWFVTVFSDCRHLNKREIDRFPVDMERLASGAAAKQLESLAGELMANIELSSEEREMKFAHDTLTVQCIVPKHSKQTIDEIDRVLAAHYGFTDEELDFIINYDIKYRMGRERFGKG